jgi:hypothetical protein
MTTTTDHDATTANDPADHAAPGCTAGRRRLVERAKVESWLAEPRPRRPMHHLRTRRLAPSPPASTVTSCTWRPATGALPESKTASRTAKTPGWITFPATTRRQRRLADRRGHRLQPDRLGSGFMPGRRDGKSGTQTAALGALACRRADHHLGAAAPCTSMPPGRRRISSPAPSASLSDSTSPPDRPPALSAIGLRPARSLRRAMKPLRTLKHGQPLQIRSMPNAVTRPRERPPALDPRHSRSTQSHSRLMNNRG